MSKISNAMVETLLEEITDYEFVKLNPKQMKVLKDRCSIWRDEESIETEINIYLGELGYVYFKFQWRIPIKI